VGLGEDTLLMEVDMRWTFHDEIGHEGLVEDILLMEEDMKSFHDEIGHEGLVEVVEDSLLMEVDKLWSSDGEELPGALAVSNLWMVVSRL